MPLFDSFFNLPTSYNRRIHGARPVLRIFSAFVFLSLTSVFGAQAREYAPYPNAEAQLSYARFLADRGDYSGAAVECGRLIEGFPGNPLIAEAQFRMADAYFNAGRFKEAEAEFRLFVSNFPESIFAQAAGRRFEEAKNRRIVNALPVVVIPDIKVFAGQTLRAAQVMNFTAKDYAGVEEEIRQLRFAGVNTIILRVFHNSGDRFYPASIPTAKAGVYFKTASAPVVDDVLGRVLPIAHRNNVKVFAWMTTRYADYGIEDDEGMACKAYDIQTSRLIGCKGLDLFNEKAVRRLEAVYSDLAAYPVDGVLFQDDLVLRHNEGFGPAMEALYKKETGRIVNPAAFYLLAADASDTRVRYTPLFWEWAAWKNRRLLNVAARLRSAVQKRQPNARFAINLMYESVTNPAYALAWLSQSLTEAVATRFDYYSIMAYHRQMRDELGCSPEDVKAMIEKMVGDASVAVGDAGKVLIKFQTVDWTTGAALPADEVVGLIRDIRDRGNVSLAVVPYRPGFPFYELGVGTGLRRAKTNPSQPPLK